MADSLNVPNQISIITDSENLIHISTKANCEDGPPSSLLPIALLAKTFIARRGPLASPYPGEEFPSQYFRAEAIPPDGGMLDTYDAV